MLYHYRLGLPNISYPKGTVLLEYSGHAIQAAENDRYGTIVLPIAIDLAKAEIIEVETDSNNRPIKILYTIPYNDMFNLTLAVALNRWVVKTCWLNEKTDVHATLDKSKYQKLTP